jgi:hypothetical protein
VATAPKVVKAMEILHFYAKRLRISKIKVLKRIDERLSLRTQITNYKLDIIQLSQISARKVHLTLLSMPILALEKQHLAKDITRPNL